MSMSSIRERLDAARGGLEELFRTHRIRLAYVFGSVARGYERPDSDLDIAVLLPEDVPESSHFDLMVRLNTDIVGLTRTNDVDVVILNTAPPLLAYEVVRTGILIHGSTAERVWFECDAIREYIDTEPIRRKISEAPFARIDRYPELYLDR